MNSNNEEKNKGINHDLLANPFFNEDNQSNNNSLNLFKNKGADAIYKNDSTDNDKKTNIIICILL